MDSSLIAPVTATQPFFIGEKVRHFSNDISFAAEVIDVHEDGNIVRIMLDIMEHEMEFVKRESDGRYVTRATFNFPVMPDEIVRISEKNTSKESIWMKIRNLFS